MQADVVCTSRVLEHWQVVFVKEHPTQGIVICKQVIYTNNQQSTSSQLQILTYPTWRNLRNLLCNERRILGKDGRSNEPKYRQGTRQLHCDEVISIEIPMQVRNYQAENLQLTSGGAGKT
jgi:hypothetical protein